MKILYQLSFASSGRRHIANESGTIFGHAAKGSHRIDPHIDRERDWVETNLFFDGTAEAYAEVDRPNALRTLSNATGDQIVTEGKISIVQLATSKRPADGPIVLKPQ